MQRSPLAVVLVVVAVLALTYYAIEPLPVKPDGELGAVELRNGFRTWYGGWRIAIKPANQEGGNLYLTPFGGFRFFNHSW